MERYDVVVVGGGPAGSMAARAAAEKGAATLLLERDPHIGLPVRCGEGVSLKNIKRYVSIDKRWIAAEVEGMVMYAPDGSAVQVANSDEVGVILERSIFDRYLAEMAAQSGAAVITRADVEGLIMTDGTVTGVRYTRLGRRGEVKAGVVIGADGVESRVGRWAGLRTQIAPSDLESAYQKMVTNIDYDARYCHFYFGNEVAPGGYIWVFPKGERTANIGIGVSSGRCDPGEARRKLEQFINGHFNHHSVVGELAGGVPCALPLKAPYTNGLLLAGDAAHHCNPLTGGGIYTAMVSGYNAGMVAAEAVERGDVSIRVLKRFNDRIEADIITVHKRAYRLSSAVSKLTDEDLNRTAHEILSIPPQERTLRNIFLKGLFSFPKLTLDVIRAFV